MHHSMAKKRRKKSSRSNQNADSNSSTAGDPGIVVLPCGHLLHFLCAVQLYEYKEGATCPICRQPLKSTADFVLFSPRRWPGSTPQGIQVDECTNTSDKGSDDSSDDVQFTGERRLAAVDAYERLIRRNTDELKQRRRNLRGREQDLASSKEQLLDRCLTLEQSAADARRRCEVLTQQGAVGLERLVELRNVARETHASVNLMTAELATLTRQQGVLDRQLEKYSQKLRCCKSGRRSDTTDGEVDAPRGSGSSAPLQKRRLRRLEGGNMLSYYVSHN
ncbi:hypothetical protein DQ04_03001040 [Trypanosoma grayi]|uniref:hypothetical protein n=1 Tax=Trypanosoma grayi TaxID=71804 RepID=UPI0004F46442|nr:hypothetical protein DQ04_03001040 [Trypanosoma grayi]KEG11079.1 hypothetical protein DQ04_03001040 [Trypanosoma grayi]